MKSRTTQDVADDERLLDVEKTKGLVLAFNEALKSATQQEMIAALYAFASHVDSTLGRKYIGGFEIATQSKHRDFTVEDYTNIFSQAMSPFFSDDVEIQNSLMFKALGEAIMDLYRDAADESSLTHSNFVTLNKLKNGVQLFEKVLNSRGVVGEYPTVAEIEKVKPALKIFPSIVQLEDAIYRSTDASIQDVATRVLNDAKEAARLHPEKLPAITHAVNVACEVVKQPTDKNIKQLQSTARQISHRSWGLMLGGSMLALAGVAFAVTCTAVALVSFGALAPVGILGLVLATSMVTGGIAIGVGTVGVTAVATGSTMFAVGTKQGKETRQLRHDLKELAKDAKKSGHRGR